MAVCTGTAPLRVAVLVREGLLPMELGIVHQLFGQASDQQDRPLYEVVTCGVEPGWVRTTADFAVAVEHGPEALAEADTVVVLASRQDYTPGPDGRLDEPLASALGRVRLMPGSPRCAPGPSCSPPPGCSTAAGRRPTGTRPRRSARSTRACRWTPRCSTWTRAGCSPRPGRPPGSTCACT